MYFLSKKVIPEPHRSTETDSTSSSSLSIRWDVWEAISAAYDKADERLLLSIPLAIFTLITATVCLCGSTIMYNNMSEMRIDLDKNMNLFRQSSDEIWSEMMKLDRDMRHKRGSHAGAYNSASVSSHFGTGNVPPLPSGERTDRTSSFAGQYPAGFLPFPDYGNDAPIQGFQGSSYNNNGAQIGLHSAGVFDGPIPEQFPGGYGPGATTRAPNGYGGGSNVWGQHTTAGGYGTPPTVPPIVTTQPPNGCPLGAPGAPGEAGYDGMIGDPGYDGMPGKAGTLFPDDYGDDGCQICPPGAQGAPGIQGALGVQGQPGYQGDRGRAGEPGRINTDVGPLGPTGPPGRDGNPGYPGPAGNPAQGGQGRRGPPGYVGAPGVRGGPGSPGIPSTESYPGRVGFPGAQGPPGNPGITGPEGFPGDVGSPGGDAGYCPCPGRTQPGGYGQQPNAWGAPQPSVGGYGGGSWGSGGTQNGYGGPNPSPSATGSSFVSSSRVQSYGTAGPAKSNNRGQQAYGGGSFFNREIFSS